MGPRVRRASAVCAAVFVALTAACGTIVFGADQVGVDAGSMTPNPGPGSGDTGASPDGPCKPLDEPPFPPVWPFQRTKSAYLSNFLHQRDDPMSPTRCVGCHEGDQTPVLPLETALDAPAALEQAISELFTSSIPIRRADGRDVPDLLWAHRKMGGEAPVYTSAEELWLSRFIHRLQICRWVGAYAARPDGGGICEDVDGGAGDGALRTDAGRVCECRLEPRALSHCGK